MKNEEIIRGWEGLSEYLGGISTVTLWRYAKQGIIKKRKFGKHVIFFKSEINEKIVEQ